MKCNQDELKTSIRKAIEIAAKRHCLHHRDETEGDTIQIDLHFHEKVLLKVKSLKRNSEEVFPSKKRDIL